MPAQNVYFNEQLQCYLFTCCQWDSRTGNVLCSNPGSHAQGSSSGAQGTGSSGWEAHMASPNTSSSRLRESGRSPRPSQGGSGSSGWEAHMASPGTSSRSGSSRQHRSSSSSQSGSGWEVLMDNSNSRVRGWEDLMEPGSWNGTGVPVECLYGIHEDPCQCWIPESGLPPPPPKGSGRKDYSKEPFYGGSGSSKRRGPPPPPPGSSTGRGWGSLMK
ncbi:hypothetical protein DFH27DRAFT_366929 [Peziza echinospora]|nr:hypothetical protein DFH27DRAFT_366929 [Peziza echinospora]